MISKRIHDMIIEVGNAMRDEGVHPIRVPSALITQALMDGYHALPETAAGVVANFKATTAAEFEDDVLNGNPGVAPREFKGLAPRFPTNDFLTSYGARDVRVTTSEFTGLRPAFHTKDGPAYDAAEAIRSTWIIDETPVLTFHATREAEAERLSREA